MNPLTFCLNIFLQLKCHFKQIPYCNQLHDIRKKSYRDYKKILCFNLVFTFIWIWKSWLIYEDTVTWELVNVQENGNRQKHTFMKFQAFNNMESRSSMRQTTKDKAYKSINILNMIWGVRLVETFYNFFFTENVNTEIHIFTLSSSNEIACNRKMGNSHYTWVCLLDVLI